MSESVVLPTHGKSATAPAGRNLRSRFRRTAASRRPCWNRLRRFQPTAYSTTAPVGRNLRSRFRRTAASRRPCRNRLWRFQPTAHSTTAPVGRNLRSRFRRTAAFRRPCRNRLRRFQPTANQRPLPQAGTCAADSDTQPYSGRGCPCRTACGVCRAVDTIMAAAAAKAFAAVSNALKSQRAVLFPYIRRPRSARALPRAHCGSRVLRTGGCSLRCACR